MKYFFGFMIGAALWFFGAAVLWPWLGPMLVNPCPISTTAGCWVSAFCGGLSTVANQLKAE